MCSFWPLPVLWVSVWWASTCFGWYSNSGPERSMHCAFRYMQIRKHLHRFDRKWPAFTKYTQKGSLVQLFSNTQINTFLLQTFCSTQSTIFRVNEGTETRRLHCSSLLFSHETKWSISYLNVQFPMYINYKLNQRI